MTENMENKIGILSVMTRRQRNIEEIIFDAESIKDNNIQKKIKDMLHILDGRISFNKIITFTVKVGDEIIDITAAMFCSDISTIKDAINNHFGKKVKENE